MLKPIRWKTFPRDFIVIQIGFALFGLSIALMIRSHLGTSPWAVLEVAFSQLTGITPGRMSIIVGFTVLLGALALREKIGTRRSQDEERARNYRDGIVRKELDVRPAQRRPCTHHIVDHRHTFAADARLEGRSEVIAGAVHLIAA